MSVYPAILTKALQASEGKLKDFSVIPLAGDASTRRYYRVPGQPSYQSSFILQVAEPFVSENEFLKTRNFLEWAGIPVPRVLATDGAAGAVLQEDLGDRTLAAALKESPVFEREGFERALGLLAHLHEKAVPSAYTGQAPAGFSTAFDVEKLLWEVRFTLEHFYGGVFGYSFGQHEQEFLREWEKVCALLAKEPRVYTHRDYHSRNLMLTADNRLVMIDFQDARMGLRQYDLVSILRDSYYPLSEANVEAGICYYAKACGFTPDENFVRMFDWMTLQRSFKAIGSFGYQASVRKNTSYMQYVEPAFQNVRRVLKRYPELQALERILAEAANA